jgi:hypothetical protein
MDTTFGNLAIIRALALVVGLAAAKFWYQSSEIGPIPAWVLPGLPAGIGAPPAGGPDLYGPMLAVPTVLPA